MTEHTPRNDVAETLREMGRRPAEALTPMLQRLVATQEWLDTVAALQFCEPHQIPEDAQPVGKVEDEQSPTGVSFIYVAGDPNETSAKVHYKIPAEP